MRHNTWHLSFLLSAEWPSSKTVSATMNHEFMQSHRSFGFLAPARVSDRLQNHLAKIASAAIMLQWRGMTKAVADAQSYRTSIAFSDIRTFHFYIP